MAAQKKVIVRRFIGDSLAGYLPAAGFLSDGHVALLDLAGRVTPIPLAEIKFIAFVRNFELSEAAEVDRTLRRNFLARPRIEGLWVRVSFRTGDTLEGVAPSGLGLLDDVLALQGLLLTPPDTRTNTQRIFVPRPAMQQMDVLGVVAKAARQRSRASSGETDNQNELFASTE